MIKPSTLTFVQYKKKYLGTSNKLFAFIKPKHAHLVRTSLKFDFFRIKEGQQDFYIASPSTNPRKPLNVKELRLRTIDFETGLFYGTINNMEVAIIDDVRQINDDVVKLESNYTVDGDYLGDEILCEHLQDVYEGKKLDMTDYEEKHIIIKLRNMSDALDLFGIPEGYDEEEEEDEVD